MPSATAGWQQQQESHSCRYHSQNCLQTLLFCFFFLSPYFWWENNRTIPPCWKTYWNCIAFELGTLCGFFCFLFFFLVQFCSTLCIPFDETTTEQHLRHHLQETETDTKIIKTETSLHLNLEVFFFLFFILFYFIFIYITFIYLFLFLLLSLIFLSFIFNPLPVSLRPVQLTVD
jgi:hypothetical protein